MPSNFSNYSNQTLPGAAEAKWRIPKVVPRPHRRRARRRTLTLTLTKAVKLFLLVSVCILLPFWIFSKVPSSDKSIVGQDEGLEGDARDIGMDE